MMQDARTYRDQVEERAGQELVERTRLARAVDERDETIRLLNAALSEALAEIERLGKRAA